MGAGIVRASALFCFLYGSRTAAVRIALASLLSWVPKQHD